MNIEDAIKEFESRWNKTFRTTDRQRILAVVQELGISEFKVSKDHISNIKTGVIDLANEIGIHSTMIVAGMPFAYSRDRGPDPYPHRTHHCDLAGWNESPSRLKETTFVNRVTCPVMTYQVPVGVECECGVVHQAE